MYGTYHNKSKTNSNSTNYGHLVLHPGDESILARLVGGGGRGGGGRKMNTGESGRIKEIPSHMYYNNFLKTDFSLELLLWVLLVGLNWGCQKITTKNPVSCLVLRCYVMPNDQFITVNIFFEVWPTQTIAMENKKNGLSSQNDYHIA